MGCCKLDKRDPAIGKVLLMRDVSVGGTHHIEPGVLGGGQEISVRQAVPAHVAGGLDIVASEQGLQAARHVRIKQDAGHALLRSR